MTPHETIAMKIAELDAALKSVHPSMPSLLQVIHRTLQNDAETTTLLSSEEMSVIVSSLSKQTETTIQTSMLSGGKGKSLKKIGLDDI